MSEYIMILAFLKLDRYLDEEKSKLYTINHMLLLVITIIIVIILLLIITIIVIILGFRVSEDLSPPFRSYVPRFAKDSNLRGSCTPPLHIGSVLCSKRIPS